MRGEGFGSGDCSWDVVLHGDKLFFNDAEFCPLMLLFCFVATDEGLAGSFRGVNRATAGVEVAEEDEKVAAVVVFEIKAV